MARQMMKVCVAAALLAATAWAQSPPAPASAQVAGALTQDYSFLLDSESKKTLDEINRSLREAIFNQNKKDTTPEARQMAVTAQADAEKRLVEALEKAPGVVRVTFADKKAALEPAPPYNLPGDVGAFLFRIDRGPGPPHFVLTQVNFAESGSLGIPVESTGTTWAVCGLANVPRMRTTLRATFTQSDTPLGMALIDVMTPDQGRLKLSVLAAETGKTVPAMVRLVWKIDGSVRRPDNGIDFNPQFDHQGNNVRLANLPGRLRGIYWCVPGPIDMALPAGEWEVTIRRGAEHVPVFDTFTVSPHQTVEKSYVVRRWVDMRNQGWYSGDDHVHCQVLSASDATRLMTWAQAEDVHLVNIVKMGDIYRTFFEQRGFGKANRVIDGDYVLAPGQECPRTNELGHTLAMNISSMVRDTDKYYLYDWVFDQVHAQGGLSGYAHVLSDSFHVHRDMSMNVPRNKVDFVELMQFFTLGTDLYYEFLNAGFKITGSAGSDVPWGGTIGEVRLYAHVGNGPFTADRWFDAVQKGHTFVTDGPMLDFRVNDAWPGDQIDLKDNKPLKVRAKVLGSPEGIMPSKLEIVRNGEVIKTIQPSDPQQTELAVEFEVEPGQGYWIAARAEGSDGTKAHSTPIYVVRPGLRFWKFEDIDNLINKRLANLDEIEELVKDYTAKDARGEIDNNRVQKQFALQGPELMKRVNAARQLYLDLKQVAEQERPVRMAAAANH